MTPETQDLNTFGDQQLINKYLTNGDNFALDVLVRRYLPQIYNFVFKYMHTAEGAEDVTQDAFVKIWTNLRKYNPNYTFKTWAFTIAKNTALDHLKKKGLVPFSDLESEHDSDFAASIADTRPLTEQTLLKIEDTALINRAMSRLPENQRQLITLYYEHGFNLREISERLKQSINTVKTRHRRALAALKKHLQD